ncbi:hypothetical protein ULVI_02160 [Cochleicola gelatinilyticus]|uniref:Outer membrane protein beta-barrel domain-containing protein n=2 Tax=Cochleicola gelatinilyticus TaxID=1763537 RepID=A0A167IEQ4_9FLAO|nr:hypothetical protein ULVI_02160 [Cochleicola gelatinilyticus]
MALVISFSAFSQDSERSNFFKENYTSTTTLGIVGNYDGRFSNEGESKIQKGLAVEVNTLHGLFFFNYVSVSVGLGIDWNIDRTFWTLPVLADLRVYFNEHGNDNSPFVFLQMGKNIQINNVFKEGRPVKLGVGITLEESERLQYILEMHKKFKEVVFIGERGFYNVTGFGVSFGIKF